MCEYVKDNICKLIALNFNCRFYILFLLSGLVIPVFSQSKAKISGIVTDMDGQPVEIATVYVKGTITGALTNAQGFYSVSVTKNDSCILEFSCIGFNKTRRIIPNVAGDMVINVQLRNMSIELGGVIVQGNRIRTGAMDRLDPKYGKLATDASGGSIESMIVTYGMGASSTNELSTQYSVRGGSYDENIVYVNGIEVYRPLLIRSGQQEGLSFINPDLTAEIGFSSGGYEARYGDKMSSVLDITYKKPEAFEGSVGASMLGATGYVGSHAGKFTQVTGIRYKRGTTLLNTLDTKGTYDPTFVDLQTYMTYAFSPRWEISFLGNLANNTYRFFPDIQETSFGTVENAKKFKVYFDGKEEDSFQTLFGAGVLKYHLDKNTTLGLQVSAFQSQEQETYDVTGEYYLSDVIPDDGNGTAQEDVIGIGVIQEHARNRLLSDVVNIAHVGSHLKDTHALQWSIGYQREKVQDRIREWEARDSMGYSLPYNGETVNVFSNLYSHNNIETNRFSGYVQDTYKFRKDYGLFSVTAGIRGSYWDFNREFIFSPRASVGFIPSQNQHLTFRFATGLYYQAPFYKEFRITETDEYGNSYITLNNDIRSQRSIHFVLGGDYGFFLLDRLFKFTTEMYYKKLDNLVPYSVNNVRIRYLGMNAASGYATGVDFKLFGEFVQGTDSWLTFSLMKAQQNMNGFKSPLPTDQRYNISMYFTDYFPSNERIQMNLRLIWSGGLPFSAPGHEYENAFRAPDYRRVDIGMSYLLLGENDAARDRGVWRYLKNVWLGVDVFNLLDINNVDSYTWITDIYGTQYAVPNYLTGRQLNVKLLVNF